MKNVLFVGEHPLGVTGNSNMMASRLEQVDTNHYIPACSAKFASCIIALMQKDDPFSQHLIVPHRDKEAIFSIS